ncbi:transcriptional regulator [Schlegelella sp. S2-27]|uniref:Transcriptional regulator n=1 Tax=Caldimonas mangrovi TaxID=2944811 RepID=A0ABT0YWA5_9BURK|nr:transcriptional regulator [Caldimonas mangrovi]MCM5682607.1 transcriptional regulator [Caldimonas mangrovi]
MALTKHPRQLLVIIAEAALEKSLVRDVKRLGAHGYTVYDVRGEGESGVREGAWEADRTIEMKVICEAGVADQIAQHVLTAYAPHYGVTMFFADALVLRPEKF